MCGEPDFQKSCAIRLATATRERERERSFPPPENKIANLDSFVSWGGRLCSRGDSRLTSTSRGHISDPPCGVLWSVF